MSGRLPERVRARVAELAGAHGLPPEAIAAIEAYLDLLATDPQAPTTVRDPERAVDVHVADALTGLRVDAVRSARTIADLGAGAGVPGLVLAAAQPAATVYLVESVSRKCAFLERAVLATGARGARVVCERAETWSAGRGACDAVTARALDRLPVVLEYAAPLLRDGGVAVLWRGVRDEDDERRAQAAAAELGLELVEVARTQPFPAARNHHLHVYSKVSPTPDRFPRRPGVARKRPLGGPGRGRRRPGRDALT